MAKSKTIEVQGTVVSVQRQSDDDYISLIDIAKHKEPDRSDTRSAKTLNSVERNASGSRRGFQRLIIS